MPYPLEIRSILPNITAKNFNRAMILNDSLNFKVCVLSSFSNDHD